MKTHHVYRPPRPNRFLSTAVIFGGGALLTFLVFYFIPLMQKLGQKEEEQKPDLIPVITQKEEEYQEPEKPEDKEDPLPPPEMTEASDDIPIDAPELPSLAGGSGRVIINITPSVRLGGASQMDAGGVDSDPVASSKVAPAVPIAVRKKLSGRGPVEVIVSALVDARGEVVDASIATSSGMADLDKACVNAVNRYKFKPAIRGGRKAKARVKVPFNFRIQQ